MPKIKTNLAPYITYIDLNAVAMTKKNSIYMTYCAYSQYPC